MFISAKIKEKNIAEYVLYMWQIEDIIRACGLDIEIIDKTIIQPQEISDEDKKALKKWYKDFCNKMVLQRIQTVGHLHEVADVSMELTYLHNSLLSYYKDEKYISLFSEAEKFVEEYKSVSKTPNASNIELFFSALYGKLMLKLRGKEISESSEEAFDAFRKVLGYLSIKFNEMKEGKLV
jgi:hypothetical protein